MIKLAATLLLLFITLFSAYAQNYECIKPHLKQYFTNSAGYIKGIGLDSVTVSGNDVTLYPFRTLRGYYYPPGTKMDTTGGSWIGKRVTIQRGGVYCFENGWNDTIFIMSGAGLNDTWPLYTTTKYNYDATVTAIDTMTFMGVIDSVKTITIKALQMPDLMNGRKIILSKNHGFVQLPDLYNFPFRVDSIAINQLPKGIDYFYDRNPDPMGDFSQTLLKGHRGVDIYNYNIGDTIMISQPGYIGTLVTLTKVITQKNTTPSQVIYTADIIRKLEQTGKPATYSYSTETITADTNAFFGMPENYLQNGGASYFYKEYDVSYCQAGPKYRKHHQQVCCGGQYYGSFEESFFKTGIGFVSSYYNPGKGSEIRSVNVKYYNIGGKRCNPYLSVSGLNKPVTSEGVQVYPVPANDMLIISTVEDLTTAAIILKDMSGRTLYSIAAADMTGKIQIPVTDLPSGIYTLSVTDEKSSTYIHRKVLVQH